MRSSVFTSIAAMLALSISALAQTTSPVTPSISNGQVTVTVKDSSGGSHVVAFPVTAVTTLSVGSGTDSYTPPAAPPPVSPTLAPPIPYTAKVVNLLPLTNWKPCEHDAGTPGTATCAGGYPVTGITAITARSFWLSYTNAGGVRQ